MPAVGPTERIRGGYDDETDNRRLLFFTGTGNEREFLTVLDVIWLKPVLPHATIVCKDSWLR